MQQQKNPKNPEAPSPANNGQKTNWFRGNRFLVVSLVVAAIFTFYNFKVNKNFSFRNRAVVQNIVKPALAQEIYPMFICPCCGKPLAPKNICCAQAKERIDYIDSETKAGKIEKEIMLDFVKKYGLNSFVDKQKQADFKKELEKNVPDERPIIAINPLSYDFGDVSQKKGIATTFFEIKNEGKTDLIINKLDSSCGCTSASVVFQGVEGPRFAMAGHGIESPKNWSISTPQGQKAQLKVYYDPDVHKDFRGAAVREIYVYSNDPIDFEKKVKIELNQVD